MFLALPDSYDGSLGKELSAKMVRTWRKKQKTVEDANGATHEEPAWLRRSRLVAREFAFLEQRDDVYSPSSCFGSCQAVARTRFERCNGQK